MTEATEKQHKWRWEINMGTLAVPDWQRVVGLQEFAAPITPTDQEDNDYDNDGWLGDTRTARKWAINAKISYRKDTATSVANAVHEQLRIAASKIDPEEGVVHMRWFDKFGGVQAHEGYGLVTWTPDGGGTVDLERITLVVGPSATSPALVDIANPVNLTPLPIVAAVSPNTGPIAGGTLVTLSGANFTGATIVAFGATNATQFTVISPTKISVISPAAAASVRDVRVTTPNGQSANTVADDFTYTA